MKPIGKLNWKQVEVYISDPYKPAPKAVTMTHRITVTLPIASLDATITFEEFYEGMVVTAPHAGVSYGEFRQRLLEKIKWLLEKEGIQDNWTDTALWFNRNGFANYVTWADIDTHRFDAWRNFQKRLAARKIK